MARQDRPRFRFPARLERIRATKKINLLGKHEIAFDEKTDLVFNKRQKLPFHTNGMRFSAFDAAGGELATREYYSVGGGFVVNPDEAAENRIVADTTALPHPFHTGDELLKLCADTNKSIAQVMFENEKAWRSEEAKSAPDFWPSGRPCHDCVARGMRQAGTLPGGLHVQRRAPAMVAELKDRPEAALKDPLTILDWVNLYALAVNEENAAGGRVVTAPTNGAAGIVPAVLHYYHRFVPGANEQGVHRLPAHRRGDRTPVQGKRLDLRRRGRLPGRSRRRLLDGRGRTHRRARRHDLQVENAAEIGMEHNLGLTCDPIGGLVQIPCIERNAMGSVKAINAQRMAMRGDGKHRVSLDKVIRTMRDTGRDMQDKYKETSRGGLAVNVIEC